MSYLVQILLPTSDNEGAAFSDADFRKVSDELTGRFGGLTAFTRSPAEGRWTGGASGTEHDNIVVFEVMADELDVAWWREYRALLERRFRQDVIVVRAQETTLL